MNTKEIIKQLAKERNMTIAELERKTGISNGTIGKWDKQTPSTDPITKIANFLHVSVDYLLGISDVQTIQNNENDKEVELNDSTVIMTLDGDELTESERQVILAATRALIEQRKKEGKK